LSQDQPFASILDGANIKPKVKTNTKDGKPNLSDFSLKF